MADLVGDIVFLSDRVFHSMHIGSISSLILATTFQDASMWPCQLSSEHTGMQDRKNSFSGSFVKMLESHTGQLKSIVVAKKKIFFLARNASKAYHSRTSQIVFYSLTCVAPRVCPSRVAATLGILQSTPGRLVGALAGRSVPVQPRVRRIALTAVLSCNKDL